MHLTLEEWAHSTDDHKLLLSNLETNLEVMTEEHGVPEHVLKSLMRVNLIVIRQFAEQTKK